MYISFENFENRSEKILKGEGKREEGGLDQRATTGWGGRFCFLRSRRGKRNRRLRKDGDGDQGILDR